MITPTWQLITPIDAIIFDCDGTLSTIEGIDELAKNNAVYETVRSLTAEAMGKSGMTPELYSQRLDLVQPAKEHVIALGQQYFDHQTPDASRVIQLLLHLNKAVYIVSAGLYPAVEIFATRLKIPREHIFAVNIEFDSKGQYLNFDHQSPLVTSNGKRDIVTQLKAMYPNILYIGDGLNDYAVYDLVTRFIGYGGAYYRENIAALCQYYITLASMAPLLPLCLTQNEYQKLTSVEQSLYTRGLVAIQEGRVLGCPADKPRDEE